MRSRAMKKTKMMSKHSSILCLLLMTILLMGIGYAAINSITGEISGTVIAEQQNDVFITSVEYVSDVDADLARSNITYYKGTYMQSTVKLSETNPSSEITYKVTVYNNSENTYPFLTTLFDEEFYDNPNIVFEIKDTGFKVGDLINGKETKEIYITFKYKDGVLPDNKTLNSNINFKIGNPNRLVQAEYGTSTSNYLGSTITRDKIETVKFELGTLQPEGTVASFDASEKQDESIIGYYTDTDENGMYELTFLSTEPIAPNVNGQYLFCYLSNVKEITFNNFTTYGVTSMNVMFSSCSGLTELDVSSFDTSKVTSMSSMFYSCSGLPELDVSGFDTSQVTNMGMMFYNCSELTELDVSGFDTSQVTNMTNMFYNCSKLTELNVSGFDTSKVTNMYAMFNRCDGLTNLDVSGLFNTSKVTDMSSMFAYCSKLTELDVSGFDTSQVTNMNAMFYQCKGLTELDLSGFDTSKVTNMTNMFYDCSGLTELDISGFDTSQVTNMGLMFYNCSELTELDVSGFDTSQVTSMSYMFSKCRKLTELDVSGFDTSQVTDMHSIFLGCSGLTEIDVSSFDTSKVTNMSNMFSSCSKLTTIYVSEYDEVAGTGWTTSAVTDSSDMFTGSTKLVGQNGTIYDSNYTDAKYAKIDKPEGVSPSEIFDVEGTNPDGLHIGDFINYDAGTWTQEEINSIQTGLKTNLVTANGSTELPSEYFQFGGFTAGSSRNGNATPYKPYNATYNYVKDAETGEAITGWRVFDVEGDTVTLISAGNPEDYYHPYGTNYGYISEYILTGNINSSWSAGSTAEETYQKRNWDMYVNTSQYGESAGVLTKAMLDAWYTKYTDSPNANTWTDATFQKIYQEPYTKYQNMIENYSYYWLSSARSSNFVYGVGPYNRDVDDYGDYAFGVRAVVSLKSNVQFTATKAGTKTVTGGNTTVYGGDQTYNVWGFGQPGYLTDIKRPVSPSEIFDEEGTNPDGLHIGDFVNYDAGTWTQEEINSIQTGLKTSLVTANGTIDLPTEEFQFGGFTAGSSRNGNATPYSTYNYVKDAETGETITGWRVFDIEGDTVTLISAGNPEDYCQLTRENYGYISEYILTGNINSSWSNGQAEAENYQKRNWDMYINRSQYGAEAGVLTKAMLDAWYTKYTDSPNADTETEAIFQKIYQQPYIKFQNIIDNYSHYWLAFANCSNGKDLYSMYPNFREVNDNYLSARPTGVRAIVTLESNVKLIPEKVGTKTVTGGNMDTYGGPQTYNVWDIAERKTEIITPQTLTVEDYGGQVSNYSPTNGSPVGWKIFHTDGQNIYLIADNYIANQYKPKGKNGTAYNSLSGTYGSNLNAGKDYAGITDILSSLKTKWLNKYTYTSTYNNMKATAYLLDTNVWATFKDSTGYADYAVGTPTLELFTASYNVTHDTDINVQASSSTGYKMKWSNSSTYSNEITGLDTTESLYIINNLYNRTVFGTWLASPNAYSSSSVCLVRCTDPQNSSSARINYAAYTSNGGGLRPVVVLKSNYGLEVQADGTYKITEINQ